MPTPGDHDDDEVVAFLRRKRAGEQISGAAHFHEADVYAADPSSLTAGFQAAAPGGSWFFFTHVRPKSGSDSRKSRLVGGGVGTWHSERAPRRVVDGEGNCVGHSQYFSYKRKTGKNCSERTEWYMVEFSDEQEADHERVRGGKPQMVLCKIYKAHSCSRSASTSSARKRKATDERINLASAPTKAKRRLFGSPAPAMTAASQEYVSSRGWYELAASLNNHPLVPLLRAAATSESHGKIGVTEPLQSDAATSASHGKIGGTEPLLRDAATSESHGNIGGNEPLLRDAATSESHGKIGGTEAFLGDAATSESHGKIGGTEALLSDAAASESHGKISGTESLLRGAATSGSHGKIGGTQTLLSNAATSESHGKIGGTSDFFRFWPEIEETSSYDWGVSMASNVPPALKHCSGENALYISDVSATALCGKDAWSSWSSAFRTRNDTAMSGCSVPTAPTLPSAGPSWWSCVQDNWSC